MAPLDRKPPRFRVGRPALHPQLHVERDTDYVACFQQVARIQLQIKKSGATVELELEKARLTLAMGSYEACRTAAKNAIGLQSRCGEAHWLNATANLCLALVRLHVLNGGPGEGQHADDTTPPEDYVDEARTSINVCVRLSQQRDEEAVQLRDFLDTVVAARLEGQALAEALASLPSEGD